MKKPTYEFERKGLDLKTYIFLNLVTTAFWFPIYYIDSWHPIPVIVVFMLWLVATVITSLLWWHMENKK
jgi:hypothetical protein